MRLYSLERSISFKDWAYVFTYGLSFKMKTRVNDLSLDPGIFVYSSAGDSKE
ncbi:hypothetical protein NHE_0218 [Neorickettsia helminthoeca str. Oregon]|uniref:Uncharacterized protein n=1 Tax=Neorickettsia helminthoeca str. Oregon TaxID=1286528 RepID=X5GVT3_9RICK|nr:hypothetical protein NHE_0218 [Neorickettsia helminthoeca str. Oregon]